LPPHAHRDRINRIRPRTLRIAQTRPNHIERAILRLRPEHTVPVFEPHRIFQELNIETRIELEGCGRRLGLSVHEPLRTRVGLPFTLSSRALNPSLRMLS